MNKIFKLCWVKTKKKQVSSCVKSIQDKSWKFFHWQSVKFRVKITYPLSILRQK